MVKATLAYNPYVLETTILFNGKSPRINSVVEKYQDMPLQKWVKELPRIFHDEMNGYGFELEFSGTKFDYEKVKAAFLALGIDEDSVHVVLKNELDNRSRKVELIKEMTSWLDQNRNRRFDFEFYCEEEQSLYDGIKSLIVIGEELLDTSVLISMYDISSEQISKIDELDNTDLTYTPILISITSDMLFKLQKIFQQLLSRNDISQDQLFFYIESSLDQEMVERILQDLGIRSPRVVSDNDLSAIIDYMEGYPISDFIYKVVSLLREKANEIAVGLDKDKEESYISNKELHEGIANIENDIRNLKKSLEMFLSRDNIEAPKEWFPMGEELFGNIKDWRKRKTKIVKEAEAIKVADEFVADIHKWYYSFVQKLEKSALAVCQGIDYEHFKWYQSADVDIDFEAKGSGVSNANFPALSISSEEFLSIKTENIIENKEESIFGKIFKVNSDKNGEQEKETVYYYQQWRDHAKELVLPNIEKAVQSSCDMICIYDRNSAEAYIEHVKNLINEKEREKAELALGLSEEEKSMQLDEDWFTEFCDRLQVIERG